MNQTAPPLVTVISVCRNHLRGLMSTLESVDRLDYSSLEVIVIDGASEDGTKQYLEDHATNSSVRYVSEPDGGIYDAMNKGLRMASGELVVFMNAGDRFSSATVVNTVVDSYMREDWEWGYGCLRVLGDDGTPMSVTSFIPFRRPRLAVGRSVVPHQAVFMKRSLLEALGGFDVTVGLSADQELCYRASLMEPPHLWAEFFVDFEGGGAGSGRRPDAFCWEMFRARQTKGVPLAGSRTLDWLLSTGVAGWTLLLHLQGRARRKLRVYA